MRITTVCPCCQARVPTRWWIRGINLRTCKACGALLLRVNTDRQPWTLLILLGLLVPVMCGLAWGLIYAWATRWYALPLAVGALVWLYAVNLLQFPFTNRYIQWHPHCEDCGYDMRHSSGSCPECHGKASHHPGEASLKISL